MKSIQTLLAFSVFFVLPELNAKLKLEAERTNDSYGISISIINEGTETAKIKYPKTKKFRNHKRDSPFFMKFTSTPPSSTYLENIESTWWNSGILSSTLYRKRAWERQFKIIQLKPSEKIQWEGNLDEMIPVVDWKEFSGETSIKFRYWRWDKNIDIQSNILSIRISEPDSGGNP